MINLEKNELILWKKKANMKVKSVKIPGTLFVTNKKIVFKPMLTKNEIIIRFKEIRKSEVMKGLTKKIKIISEKEYIFFVKEAEAVARLIKTLI
ncbi:hypothetical protein B6U81_05595 [Thermoplasmatales archaeon ex4484_30]|nr:MAG: hypothetical protein FE041_01210 [Thermoplasmata archaeon]OYT59755.1 MAG: hypothetical protein B6U81_05595 [Thermoplasmatales archaeon ex4484_30]